MRLIDADALKSIHGMKDDCAECDKELRHKSRSCEFDRVYTLMDFCGWIDDAPTIEPKKGRWIPVTKIYKVKEEQFPQTCIEWIDATEPDEVDGVRCSECSTVYDFTEARNWCSECGADMREGDTP